MKKLLSFLCLVGILFAFQAKLNAIPTYLVIDLETRASRYTDEAPDLRNDTCRTTELWLRYIPAGTFTMGSPVGEDGREDPSDETQHQVTLSQPYYIGVFEVTQAQWEAIMNFGAPIVWGGETIPARPSYFKNDEHYATRPVESVSYYMIRGEEAGTGWPNSDEVDDLSFMGILRELTGLKFDLPTEAQWEYACRAGTTTALNSGKALFDPEDEVENMDAVGRYMYNSGFYKDFLDDEGNRELSVDEFGTAKVGSYAPNAWGLYDMHGNVVEWCLDWFYGDDYSADDVTDPVGEEFDPDLEVSVCRGGSWCSEPYKCRSAFRGISNSYADDYENGFRLVCLTMPETHTVTVVNGTDNKGDAINDEKVTITANNPATGMVFDKWTSDDVTFDNANDAETTFQMPDKAVTVTATYKDEGIQKYPVTVTNGTADKDEYAEDETVKITADEPPSGKVFSHWTSNSGVTFMPADNPTTTFRMPGKYVFVKANWKNAPKYEVTVENGIADEDEYEYAKGETVKITADNPPVGKVFDKWTSEDEDVPFDDPTSIDTTFTMPAHDVTVTATYKEVLKFMVMVENGTTKKEEAAEGETVEIKANNPPDGKVFDHWVCEIGGVKFADEYAEQTTFTMPGKAVRVQATYKDAQKYSVTVVKGTADKDEYAEGKTVTIKAWTAQYDEIFDHWVCDIGGVTFEDANAMKTTFFMPARDVIVRAAFKDKPKYEVTVENGTAEPSTAYSSDIITITANKPPAGKVFDCWTSEDGVTFTEADNARTTFRMLGKAVKVTATYKDARTYTVTVTNGTADPQEAYAGDTVTITANAPAEHKLFDQWTSDDVTFDEADNARTTFRMPAENVAVTANYIDEPIYTVTVRNGTANPSKAYAGQRITIKANTPSPGSVFAQWTGEGVTIRNANEVETTFIMPANDVTVTAYYQLAPKFAVTVEYGSADKTQTYEGDTVEIEAQAPAEHKLFDKWTSEDDVTFADPNVAKTTFTMLGKAVKVTATYADEPKYTVTVENGTANPSEAYAGDTVTITANNPAEHKLFDEWTGDVEFENENVMETTFVMPAEAVTVTATYKDEPKYAVTVENGTADKTEAYAGETITITANDPAEHFQFDSWTGDVEFTNADAVQTTFAMPANAITVTATYLEDTKYSVTVVGGKANKRTAYEGEEITITANRPASGQAFDAWSGDVDLADATATPTTFTMPGRAVSVTATFKTLPKTYKIVVVNGTTDKAKAAAGEVVTLTAKPAPAGKVFDRWAGGAVFDDPNSMTTTFTMPAKAVTPKALYKKK
ncbi:MAG: SUMF1/EgtB/PvdO family nonheme iron enzyme [Victivallales bacterium]|nr:SUMF1/EgtB/PvdO family nonheme iron enzyme [Victivallales bacterium]